MQTLLFLTSQQHTPLLNEHLLMVPATYQHYIFGVPQVDTSPKWTLSQGPSHIQTLHFWHPIDGHL